MPIGLTGSDFFPLRAQQIYDPNQLNAQAPNVADQLSQLYQPQTQLSEAYKNALMQMPQRTEPNMLHRIAGAIAGMSAGASPVGIAGGQVVGFKNDAAKQLGVQDEITNAPYYDKLRDWQAQTKQLGLGAGEEEKENVNKRIMAEQTVQKQLNAQRQAEVERKNKEVEADRAILRQRQQQDSDTRRMNSAITKYKVEHPNHQLKVIGDKVVSYDPASDKTITLKDEDGNDLDSGKLDDLSKMNIQLQNALAEIHARGSESRATESVKETNRQSDIGARGEQARQTKQVPSGSVINKQPAQAKPQSPTQDKVAQFNRAQQVLAQHPEWQKYFHLASGNVVTSTFSSLNPFHSKDEYDKAYQAIYGTNAPAQVVNNPLGLTPPSGRK